MSDKKETSVWFVECKDCEKEGPHTHMGPVLAIAAARDSGWLVIGREVFCPDCRKERGK